MKTRLDTAQPRLVLRFAAAALLAFVLVGAGVSMFLVRAVRVRAENVATFHATFVTNAVLAPALRGVDLTKPLSPTELATLDQIVRSSILTDGRDVRVKVWSLNGQILYSDFTPLIGQRFPEEQGDIGEAVREGPVASVSDLSAAENVGERHLANKLFQDYVPVRPEPGGPVVAVAELYQDYSVVQGDIDGLVKNLSAILVLGLAVLFAILLPIVRRTSSALREQNRQLTEQAEQLNGLLAREHESVAELQGLNQKKDDFVAATSHELRTPLTSILGYVKTLKRPELVGDEDTRTEFLDAVEHQTQRLVRLITNLLAAAHVEEADGLSLAPFDFSALVHEILPRFTTGSHRVRLSIPPSLPAVVSDRGKVEDVLTNLLDNALKFSPAASPVEIGADTEGVFLLFWVKDRGVGIDPSQYESIFDRFHQLDQSSTRHFGGVGLGLHLARELVQALGGQIDVQSEPGHGATFIVRVPLGPTGPPADHAAAVLATRKP
jgi:signal transduction histidine kinase